MLKRLKLVDGSLTVLAACCLGCVGAQGCQPKTAAATPASRTGKADADVLEKACQYFSISGRRTSSDDAVKNLLMVASISDLTRIRAAAKEVYARDNRSGRNGNLNPCTSLLIELLERPSKGSPEWQSIMEANGRIFIPATYGWRGGFDSLSSLERCIEELGKTGARRDIAKQLGAYGLKEHPLN